MRLDLSLDVPDWLARLLPGRRVLLGAAAAVASLFLTTSLVAAVEGATGGDGDLQGAMLALSLVGGMAALVGIRRSPSTWAAAATPPALLAFLSWLDELPFDGVAILAATVAIAATVAVLSLRQANLLVRLAGFVAVVVLLALGAEDLPRGVVAYSGVATVAAAAAYLLAWSARSQGRERKASAAAAAVTVAAWALLSWSDLRRFPDETGQVLLGLAVALAFVCVAAAAWLARPLRLRAA